MDLLRSENLSTSGHAAAITKEDLMNNILQFFAWEHLPAHLQAVSKPFGDLAREMAATLPLNAESTTAMRKLLEAKDAAVRSVIFRPETPDRRA